MAGHKKIMRRIGLASFLLSVPYLFSFPAEGLSTTEPLTLQQAVSRALEDNHGLAAFRNSLAAQKEDIGIARSHYRPKISLEERFLRTNNPTYVFMAKLNQARFTAEDFAIDSLNDPAAENDFQTSLSLFQPILALQASVGIDMSETAYAAKKEEYYRRQESVALQVAQNYLMAQMAAEFVGVAQKGVEDAAEHLRIARVSYENGLGLYADTLRATTALTEAEQRLVSAEKNLRVARRSLGMLLGVEHPVQTGTDKLDLPLYDHAYYRNKVEERRDIQSMQFHFANAENSLRLSRAASAPTLGVGSSFQLNDSDVPFGNESDSWQVFAQLRWELFDGAKSKHEKQKARYRIAETRENLARLVNGAAFQVYESYLGVEEAQKNAELAHSALATAEEGQRLVRLRFENSLSPLVDLLDAQVSLDQARTNVLARQKEQQLATLKLCFESGVILEELGVEAQPAEDITDK
jgi:outer membrane protein TolC